MIIQKDCHLMFAKALVMQPSLSRQTIQTLTGRKAHSFMNIKLGLVNQFADMIGTEIEYENQ